MLLSQLRVEQVKVRSRRTPRLKVVRAAGEDPVKAVTEQGEAQVAEKRRVMAVRLAAVPYARRIPASTPAASKSPMTSSRSLTKVKLHHDQ